MIIIVIVVRSDDNNHHGSRWEGKVPSSGDNIPKQDQGHDHLNDNQPLWSSFSSSLVLGSKLGELSWDQKTSSWVTLLPTSRLAWLQMVTIVIIIIILTIIVVIIIIIFVIVVIVIQTTCYTSWVKLLLPRKILGVFFVSVKFFWLEMNQGEFLRFFWVKKCQNIYLGQKFIFPSSSSIVLSFLNCLLLTDWPQD